MATHSRTLAWKIPWTEEPGRLQSKGSQRIKRRLSDLTHSLLVILGIFLSVGKLLKCFSVFSFMQAIPASCQA